MNTELSNDMHGRVISMRRQTDRSTQQLSALSLLSLMIMSRIPFLFTHHMQDDAYISLRAIHNLVEHGGLAFNVGDRYSPVTSLLWGFVGAVPALFLRDEQLALGLQLIGVASIWLALIAVRPLLSGRWTLIVLALCSPALFASYLGMETGLCVLYLSLIARALLNLRPNARVLYVMAAIGPLVRPEYITVCAVIVMLAWMSADLPRNDRLFFLTAPIVASLAYVTLNFALSEVPISPSVIAKTLSYEPRHSIGLFVQRLAVIFCGQITLPGVKQIPGWIHLLANLLPLVLLGRRLYRAVDPLQPGELRLVLFLLFAAYGLPAIFCWGGQFAQWYLFPSGFLAVALALWSLPRAALHNAKVAVAAIAITLLVAVGQLMLSFSTGTQEFLYRADVGRWIRQNSAGTSSLMLEPAGYIPWFAGLTTYDYVGLVTPLVLDYIRGYGANWWFVFVREHSPDWIVDRHDLRTDNATDSGYRMTPAQAQCFRTRYRMVRAFHYDPTAYASNPVARRILFLGSHSDYFVYRLLPPSPQTRCM